MCLLYTAFVFETSKCLWKTQTRHQIHLKFFAFVSIIRSSTQSHEQLLIKYLQHHIHQHFHHSADANWKWEYNSKFEFHHSIVSYVLLTLPPNSEELNRNPSFKSKDAWIILLVKKFTKHWQQWDFVLITRGHGWPMRRFPAQTNWIIRANDRCICSIRHRKRASLLFGDIDIDSTIRNLYPIIKIGKRCFVMVRRLESFWQFLHFIQFHLESFLFIAHASVSCGLSCCRSFERWMEP